MKGKILVTGGLGFIGSHTTVELQQAGYEVVIIDNLSNSNIEVLDGIEKITGIRPVFVEGDCTNIDTLHELFKANPGINGIINFAASKAVGESIHKPILYYRNNLNILINLLDLMPVYGVKGFVFSSSCTVYGEPDKNPITEDAPTKKATSPYGATKQMSEDIIADVVKSGAPIKAILLRYFNPIGAHPSAEIGELPNGVPQNLVPYLTQTAIGVRKELSIFGAVFMATDPVTSARTETGKWIYGFIIGALAVIIRVMNPGFPEGMMLAILFGNMMAPTIDYFVVQSNINKRLKRMKNNG